MKQYIICACLIGITIMETLAQSTANVKILRSNEISAKIRMQKNDQSRLQMYTLYSAFFTEKNIYPNADAIDLIDAYNKQASFNDIQMHRMEFKTLKLPDVSAELEESRGKQHMLVINQSVRVNGQFKSAIELFNNKLPAINEVPVISASFKDSLNRFGNNILTDLNNNADHIPPLQMEFFLISLGNINSLTDQLVAAADYTDTRMALSELMEDFFAYRLSNVKTIKPLPRAAFRDNSKMLFYTVVYKAVSEEKKLPEDEMELPNANVYVYTRDADGKWDQQPKLKSFNVFYGANGLKYSLKPGCDTLSFFKYHPLVPASPLPVILAKGNYCFVLQDVANGRIYLRPDINLRDNKVIDDQQLILLCFKVEK